MPAHCEDEDIEVLDELQDAASTQSEVDTKEICGVRTWRSGSKASQGRIREGTPRRGESGSRMRRGRGGGARRGDEETVEELIVIGRATIEAIRQIEGTAKERMMSRRGRGEKL